MRRYQFQLLFFYLVVIETVTTSPVKITVATTKLGKEVFTDDGEFIYIKLRRLCFLSFGFHSFNVLFLMIVK